MNITNRRTDIVKTGTVFAVVCSTAFREPLEPIEVRLPSHPERKCITRLSEDTVAVCDWTTPFAASEIRETGGIVPTNLLREICRIAGITYTAER